MSEEKKRLKNFFNKNKRYIKYSAILKNLKMEKCNNFYQFINDTNDYAISKDKLEIIKQEVVDIAKSIAEIEI